MKKYLGVVVCLFLVACASHPNSKKVKVSGSSNENVGSDAELLRKGTEKLSSGSTKDAIENYFEPIIKNCEKKFSEKSQTYFGARSGAEAIMYAALGATLKQNTEVLDSTCGDANFFKGFALVDLGRLDDAGVYFDKAVAWSPQNSMYLAELGNLSQLKKNWQQSLDFFEQAENAAEFSPDNVKTLELLRAKRGVGFNLTELGRLDEAEKKYLECLAVDKNDKKSQGELAYIKQLRSK